ncbi:MAG: hypothetical protein JWP13_154 [Candidatus Saccharibacteria bacterium]|nr:hypothetical protein [Candidatus Saccharibacteria bacterium]
MNDNSSSATGSARQLPLSWKEGFRLYLSDPHAKTMLRRFAVRFLPIATGITVLDDFLLPGLGLVDNVSWPFLIGGTLVMLYKVNQYRHQPSPIRRIS